MKTVAMKVVLMERYDSREEIEPFFVLRKCKFRVHIHVHSSSDSKIISAFVDCFSTLGN